MNKLSFWHKLAFIANACWLATWALKHYPLPNGDIQSTIVVTGLVMAYVVNLFVNLWSVVLLLQHKLWGKAPRWLIIINFLFLIAQVYLLVK